MIFALYDDQDMPLGSYNREELRELLNTTKKSFNCIISRLLSGKHKALYIQGKSYQVYIYKNMDKEAKK